jgi:hypothetical protein
MTPGLFYMKFNIELNTEVEENSPRFPTVIYTPSNGRRSGHKDFRMTTGFAEHCISRQIAGPKEN